jgi:tubulin polyglutamylase TTLL5
MQEKYTKQYFDFIPETFVLPDQWSMFCDYFDQQDNRVKNQVIMSNGEIQTSGYRPLLHNLWICKPSASSRGRGIYIVNHLKEINRQEPCVISRYIDNPLLLHKHKFDLRIYVVVTCFDPLRIYIFREGLVRFASEKYNNADIGSEEAKFTHLTNYSINKKNDNFV